MPVQRAVHLSLDFARIVAGARCVADGSVVAAEAAPAAPPLARRAMRGRVLMLLRAHFTWHRWGALSKADGNSYRVVILGHIRGLLLVLLLNCAYSYASKRDTYYTCGERKTDTRASNQLGETGDLLSRRDEGRGEPLIFVLKELDAGLQLREPGLLALAALEGS